MQKEKRTWQYSKTKDQKKKKKTFNKINYIRTNRAHRWYGEDSDMIDELRY